MLAVITGATKVHSDANDKAIPYIQLDAQTPHECELLKSFSGPGTISLKFVEPIEQDGLNGGRFALTFDPAKQSESGGGNRGGNRGGGGQGG